MNNGEQEHLTTGTHYKPWQRAKLVDGRKVWITRQDGDGERAYYYTDKNEQIPAEEVIDWLSPEAAILGQKGGKSTSEAKAAAARRNGRKGGRPRKIDPAE